MGRSVQSPRDGTLVKLVPYEHTGYVSSNHQIPVYAADGSSLGFRPLDTANRLIAAGQVSPAYGRKGHLKAIWLRHEDGTHPIETRAHGGTRYSFLKNLKNGRRCWTLRPVDERDDQDATVNTRGAFQQVIADCLTR